jgi:GNAT superfamily N-acetyltransferase
MKIIIRKGKRPDIPAAFDLVYQLAVFEKEPNAMIANLDAYHDAFDKGAFNFFIAAADDNIVGMALYYQAFSTWRGPMLHLEDFIVTSEFRSQGIGQRLFDAFVEEARDKKCTMVKWEVLDWNEGAIRFYERNNATIEKQWWDGKIIF